MRFNCGESYERECLRRMEWHKWFAWHPVKVGEHDCRWLEWVSRRGIPMWEAGWMYEYKPQAHQMSHTQEQA